MSPTSPRTHFGRLPATLLAAIALIASACAAAPLAPTASLQAARQAITSAEGLGAGQHAPGELGEARSKLREADVAVEGERMVSANQLALESRASAELAASKTASVKARAENAAIRAGNAALVNELNRNAGESN